MRYCFDLSMPSLMPYQRAMQQENEITRQESAQCVCASRARRIAPVSKGEMAESAREFRCWVCSVSFDVERKYLRHLTTMKHADMEDILNRTEAVELEMHKLIGQT